MKKEIGYILQILAALLLVLEGFVFFWSGLVEELYGPMHLWSGFSSIVIIFSIYLFNKKEMIAPLFVSIVLALISLSL